MQKSTHTSQYRLFLDWLVKARKDAGLTQQQVADQLGRPQSFVAKYEGGERRLDVVEFVENSGVLSVEPGGVLRLITRRESSGP